jgi:hypothetical protein
MPATGGNVTRTGRDRVARGSLLAAGSYRDTYHKRDAENEHARTELAERVSSAIGQPQNNSRQGNY